MTSATVAVPLRQEPDGTYRIGTTRVTLDTLVSIFNEGGTPEDIVQQFPTLELADVYGAITYYLQHRADMDAYLKQREAEAETLRGEIEMHFPADGLRARLLARQAARTAPKDR